MAATGRFECNEVGVIGSYHEDICISTWRVPNNPVHIITSVKSETSVSADAESVRLIDYTNPALV